jgi:hypothetical protein
LPLSAAAAIARDVAATAVLRIGLRVYTLATLSGVVGSAEPKTTRAAARTLRADLAFRTALIAVAAVCSTVLHVGAQGRRAALLGVVGALALAIGADSPAGTSDPAGPAIGGIVFDIHARAIAVGFTRCATRRAAAL